MITIKGDFLQLDRCPHCSVDTPHLQRQYKFTTPNKLTATPRFWGLFTCNRCGGTVLTEEVDTAPLTNVLTYYPSIREVDNSVPESARQYLDDAYKTKGVPSGCIMLAASSIDAMLKDKGFIEGSLHNRIGEAAKAKIITDSMKDWAHQIRLEANDIRHADINATKPTSKDAERILEFTSALAKFLYELPALVNKGIETSKN